MSEKKSLRVRLSELRVWVFESTRNPLVLLFIVAMAVATANTFGDDLVAVSWAAIASIDPGWLLGGGCFVLLVLGVICLAYRFYPRESASAILDSLGEHGSDGVVLQGVGKGNMDWMKVVLIAVFTVIAVAGLLMVILWSLGLWISGIGALMGLLFFILFGAIALILWYLPEELADLLIDTW
jgi:hypothetical protein